MTVAQEALVMWSLLGKSPKVNDYPEKNYHGLDFSFLDLRKMELCSMLFFVFHLYCLTF